MQAGTSHSSKLSKELTIKAIEARLKALENQSDDFIINQTTDGEIPLIQRYQFNKNAPSDRSNNLNGKFGTRNGPYNHRNQRRYKR